MGVGNPGGATFHAVVFMHEDGYAFALVDEPFEDVAEGGPDLRAEQAPAHDTLPFIWWVADTVMERDRRARWMRHWFLGTSSIQTHEVFEHRKPVLLVVNEADDGLWQLIGSTDAHSSTGKIGHLYHAIDNDPTLLDILDLSPGHSARRADIGERWRRNPAHLA